MSILLCPQGASDAEITDLSIFIFVQEHGEFDQILSESIFEGEIEIALLSQDEDAPNFVNEFQPDSLEEMHIGYDCFGRIDFDRLENSPHFKNDTIFIQVTCTKD